MLQEVQSTYVAVARVDGKGKNEHGCFLNIFPPPWLASPLCCAKCVGSFKAQMQRILLNTCLRVNISFFRMVRNSVPSLNREFSHGTHRHLCRCIQAHALNAMVHICIACDKVPGDMLQGVQLEVRNTLLNQPPSPSLSPDKPNL